MDKFYRQNANLYERLVQAFDPNAAEIHFSRHQSADATNADVNEPEDAPEEALNTGMLVVARIRPMLDEDLAEKFPCAAYTRVDSGNRSRVVDLHDLYHYPYGPAKLKSTKHHLDKIYSADATTTAIYNDSVAELASLARKGGTGTLFAYGQTGSGKTYTISKLQELATCSLVDQAQENGRLELYLSICDLAGNSAFDLLNSREPVAVLQDAAGNTHLRGALEKRFSTKAQVLDLLAQAAAYRQTASTFKNDSSSRSHSICRVRIRNTTTPFSAAAGADGLLYLVDLAGSEAARDIATHGADRMRETREINVSLSVLKDCIRGRAEIARQTADKNQKKVHVPIRRSALTRVLRHVFEPERGRESWTVVIACVNPSLADVAASKNTLRYAEMLRESGRV